MITAVVIVGLILCFVCVHLSYWRKCADSWRGARRHLTYGEAIVIATCLLGNLAWLVTLPAMLSVECSWLGYCGVGLNDLWVQIWLTIAGIFGLFFAIALVLSTFPDEWVTAYCCDGKAHLSRAERKRRAVRRKNRREKLASIGFTDGQFIGILQDAIFVATLLGERKARVVHPHFGPCSYVYEYQDDRIRVSLATGDAVLVEIMQEGKWLKVIESTEWDNPDVVIFRPGDWIVYLEADLKDVASGVEAEREAAEAAREEARKREIESRFAWVESDAPRRAE